MGFVPLEKANSLRSTSTRGAKSRLHGSNAEPEEEEGLLSPTTFRMVSLGVVAFAGFVVVVLIVIGSHLMTSSEPSFLKNFSLDNFTFFGLFEDSHVNYTNYKAPYETTQGNSNYNPYLEPVWNCNGTFTNSPSGVQTCTQVEVGEAEQTWGHRYFTPEWEETVENHDHDYE